MSAPVSFLVYWYTSIRTLSLRRLFTLFSIATTYWCLCGSRIAFATTPSENLDAEIGTLGKTVDTTTSDVDAAFQKLKDETNLSSSTLIVGGIMTAHPGDTITWPISLVPGSFSPSALQCDLLVPTGLTFVSAVIGPAGIQAGKQLSVSISSGTPRALLFGINQTPIDDGVIVLVKLKVDQAATKSHYSIVLENPALSDGAGSAVTVSAVSGTVVVQ